MNHLQIQRTSQIKGLLTEISGILKMSVSKAIKIGELLSEQKKELAHGEFLPWLEKNVSISERSARNYMKMFEYKTKTATVADLSSAYRLVEDIENQKRVERVIADPQKESEYQKRLAESFTKKQQGYTEKLNQAKAESEQEKAHNDFISDTVKDALDSLKKAESMSLGENNYLQHNIFQAIDLYIEKFNTPSDKIMAGHNIIKHIKEIINSNQVKAVA